MLRVGLTGGIGAGKSTVTQQLAGLGAVVIDADVIAREVVEPGTPGLAAVVDEFGPGILTEAGHLDRAALGAVVFADETRREALNAIVHPRVYERRAQLLAEAPFNAVVVEDVPLLVENGLEASYPLVIVVHADAAERVRRLVAEREMTEADAWARVRAQADDEARRAAADVWLDNSGAPARTAAAVEGLWRERLVPFEENCRFGRVAQRPARPVLVPPDPSWPEQAARVVARVWHVAGQRVHRVDHVGSTSVPGLIAKDVLDVQAVVDDLATAEQLAGDLRDVGLVRPPGTWCDVWRDGSEVPKVLLGSADPARPVHLHLRPVEAPTWRDVLLLRDWLRSDDDAAADYAALKRRLAGTHDTTGAYAEAKTPWITEALRRADAWAQRVGWSPA